MKKLLFMLMFITSSSLAQQPKDNDCKDPQSSAGIEIMDKMHQLMGIETESIVQEKTITEIIANTPVTDRLAAQFAQEDYAASDDRLVSFKKIKSLYSENNARNLIIKFTFENRLKKHNVFLVSSLANDNECGVRFNGYLIVKREF